MGKLYNLMKGNKCSNLKFLVLVAVFFIAGKITFGQTTVTLGGGATVTCPATPTATWTTPPAGVTFSNWSRGSGVSCASASDGLSGSGFNTANANSSYAANLFYSVTITADATHSFTLNSVMWNTAISGSGTVTGVFNVQYKNNGGTLTSFGNLNQTGGTSNTFTGTVTVAQSTSIILYLIPSGTVASGTTVRWLNGSTISITASPASPTITVSPTTLTALNYQNGFGPSTAQSYTLSGATLSPAADNITITPPTDYEVSTDNVSFSNSAITVPYTGGALSATPIYVRLKAGLSIGSYNSEIISNSGGGATTQNVTVSGTVSKAVFTSVASTDWNTGSTWDKNSVPGPDDDVIINTAVTMNSAVTRNSGSNTTINTNRSLAVRNTYTNNGSTTVNGTFQLDNGGYANGSNDFVYASSGSYLVFNSGTGPYGIGGGQRFWPFTNQPYNVTVNTGTNVDLNTGTTRTVAGDLSLFGGFLNNGGITINGTLTLNANGYIDKNSPVYGASSTLIYNNGANYSNSYEWTGGASNAVAAGNAVPNNVTIQSSGTNVSLAGARGLAGKLTVSNGANLSLGGDLYSAGDFAFTGTGSLTGNNKAIFVVKSGTQILTSDAALTIPYLVFNAASGSTNLQLNGSTTNLTISGPSSGNLIAFQNSGDNVSIGSNSLTLGSAGNASVINGPGTFSGSTASNLTLLGAGNIGTLKFVAPTLLNNFTVNRTGAGGGVTMGSSLTIGNILTLNSGLVTLGANNLSLISTGSVGGNTANNTNMVVADGTGKMIKYFTANGTFTFPIGDNSAPDGAQYSPATLNFTSGTYAGGAYAGVNVTDLVHPNNTASTNYITRYWSPTIIGITNYTCDGSFVYSPADVVGGNEANILTAGWDGTNWFLGNATNTSTHTLSFTGQSSIKSAYTGGDNFSPLASSSSDYFRSKTSGDWATAATWESSPNGTSNWHTATLAPTSAANTITIQAGHTVGVTTSISLDQTVLNGTLEIQNGGIVNMNDGTGDDMTINNGGIYRTLGKVTYASEINYLGTAVVIHIKTGGRITIGNGAAVKDGTFIGYATDTYHNWETGSIFEWNSTSTFSTSGGITLFPNSYGSASTSAIPYFLVSSSPGSPGSSSDTYINGLTIVNSSFTFTGASTKYFRNGIAGSATLTESSTSGNSFNITGSNAILGGSNLKIVLSSPLNLTTSVTVPVDSIATISGGNINNNTTGNILTVNGTLDVTNIGITNTNGSVVVNGTYRTASTPGTSTAELVSIPSGGVTVNSGSTVELYASANQLLKSRSDFANLTFSGSGNKTITSGFNPNGNVYITGSAVLDVSNYTFGNASTNLKMDGSSRFRISGTGSKPDIDGTYLLNGGVIEYYNSGTLTNELVKSKNNANNDILYNEIEITGNKVGNGAGNINLGAGGKFTVKSTGIFEMTDNSIVGPSGSQTFIMESGSLFKCGVQPGFIGPAAFPSSPAVRDNIETISLQTGSIVDYSRATPAQVSGDQVITNTIPYQNFTISGNGTKTAPSGTLAIQGDFTKTGTATFAHNNGTVSFNGSSVQTYSNTAAPIVTFYNLTNNNTAGLKINSDSLALENQLLLNTGSKLTLNTGDIILKSRDLFTANVAAVAGTINYAGTGRFITERYINNAGHTKAWQFLSVPVNSTQSIKDAYQEGGSLGSNPKSGFGTQLTSPLGTAAGFDGSSLGPSIKTYISATDFWDAGPSNTSNSINNAKGWMIFIRGDRSLAPSFTGSGSSSTIMRSRGQLYTGNQGPYGVANGKFESVGNPYASAIDLRQTTRTNLTNEIYIWDPTLSGAFGVGGYRTLTYIGSDFHVVPAGGTYPGPISNNIQSGQAFFIKGASSGTASISLSENSKVGGSALVNGSPVANPAAMLSVNVSAKVPGSPSVLLDGDMAIFDKGYADEVDEQDGIKLKNSGENLGLRRDHYLLSVERRSLPKPNDTLNLEISGFKQKDYEFEFNTSAFNLPGVQAILWDSYTKTFTPLSGASSKVDFTVDGNAGSSSANRFKIVFSSTAAGPLPVTLTGIKAIRNADGSITVNWQSTNEINIEGYGIERSGNSSSFEGIGNQQALNNNGGSSDYTFIDNAPLNADNYYRIKAIGKDGKIQYSPIAKVAWLKHAPAISVYPNPLAGRDMQVVFASQPLGRYKLLMTNKEGQVVYTGTVNVSSSNFVKTIKLRPGLAAGSYQLTVSDINGNPVAMQVILL